MRESEIVKMAGGITAPWVSMSSRPNQESQRFEDYLRLDRARAPSLLILKLPPSLLLCRQPSELGSSKPHQSYWIASRTDRLYIYSVSSGAPFSSSSFRYKQSIEPNK